MLATWKPSVIWGCGGLWGGLIWQIVDLVWQFPGRIDDAQAWVDWVNGVGFPQDIHDWGPIVLCAIGLLILISDRLPKQWLKSGNSLCVLNLGPYPLSHNPQFAPLSPKKVEAKKDIVIEPPVVTHRGGEDFSLEVRASFTARYYGYGWLSGSGVTRDKKFNLYWEQVDNPNISRGSIATIRIANWVNLVGGYSRKLRVWGDRDIVHSDGRVGEEWLTLRVELHAHGTAESWEHHYRFRLKDGRFETGEKHEVDASSPGRKSQS